MGHRGSSARFSTAAVGCGAALPQQPLSLGSSRDWGGEETEPLGGGGIRRRAGGRPLQAVGASSRRGPRRWGPFICRSGPVLAWDGWPRLLDVSPAWGIVVLRRLRRCVKVALNLSTNCFASSTAYISGWLSARRSSGGLARLRSLLSSLSSLAVSLTNRQRSPLFFSSFPFLAALTIWAAPQAFSEA